MKEECPACEGYGFDIEEEDDGVEFHRWTVGCASCHGEGWVVREPCLACGAPIIVEPNDISPGEQHDAGCPVEAQP